MSAKTTPEYLISNAEQYANENAISWKDGNGKLGVAGEGLGGGTLGLQLIEMSVDGKQL